jgi:hypothetical protein
MFYMQDYVVIVARLSMTYFDPIFDSKYFEPDLYESFQITKFQYLSENCDGANNQREFSCVRYISGSSRESGMGPPFIIVMLSVRPMYV